MRTAGFPCRLLGCERTFQVVDQKSMDALKAASTERTEHEVAAHSYHHVRLADERSYMSFQRAKPKPPPAKSDYVAVTARSTPRRSARVAAKISLPAAPRRP